MFFVDTKNMSPGADSEILKGGCTKFSGPELQYSSFNPFFNSLVVASLWKFVLHSGVKPCIRLYGDTNRMKQYLIFLLKQNVWSATQWIVPYQIIIQHAEHMSKIF